MRFSKLEREDCDKLFGVSLGFVSHVCVCVCMLVYGEDRRADLARTKCNDETHRRVCVCVCVCVYIYTLISRESLVLLSFCARTSLSFFSREVKGVRAALGLLKVR